MSQISAPAGSGKTVLPRPWLAEAGLWVGRCLGVEPLEEGNDEG